MLSKFLLSLLLLSAESSDLHVPNSTTTKTEKAKFIPADKESQMADLFSSTEAYYNSQLCHLYQDRDNHPPIEDGWLVLYGYQGDLPTNVVNMAINETGYVQWIYISKFKQPC